jgi:fatty-acyl-CoA synthase
MLATGCQWSASHVAVTPARASRRRHSPCAARWAGAPRLANALRYWGSPATIGNATSQWNNAEHPEAYLAVPAMGSVLHNVNIRLFPSS